MTFLMNYPVWRLRASSDTTTVLLIKLEILHCCKWIFRGSGPFCLCLGGAIALLDVEIATACGAQTTAIGLAEHHKRRVHNDRVIDGLTQIDDTVLTQELVAVLVGLGILGLIKEVELLNLTGNIKRSGLQATVALASGVRADHTGEQDTGTGIGKDNVVVDAVLKLVLLLAHRVGGDIDLTGQRIRISRKLELLGKIDGNARELSHSH